MKKSILTTLLFAVLYFLCMGIGVLLGSLFDQTGTCFMHRPLLPLSAVVSI